MSKKKITSRPLIPYVQPISSVPTTKMDEIFLQKEYGGFINTNLSSTPLPGVSTTPSFTDFNNALVPLPSLAGGDRKAASLSDIIKTGQQTPNTEGGEAPYTASDFEGSNRYDFYLPGTDNEGGSAQNQSWMSVMFNGVAKGLALTGTTFLQTTIGTVNGLLQWQETGKFSSFYDNDFNRALNEFNEELEQRYLPSYESKKFRDAAWYSPDYLFTSNFLWEGIIKNLGFAAGAALSGYAYGGILKGLGALSRATAAGKLETAIMAAEESIALGEGTSGLVGRMAGLTSELGGTQQILDKGYRLTVAGLATTGEAGIEAYHNLNDFRKNAIEEYKQINGYAPVGEDLERINETADNIGNASFKMNMGLLSATNYIQFPKIIGKHFKADKAMKNDLAPRTGKIELVDGVYQESKRSVLKRAGRAIRNPYIFSYAEALEESGQFAISNFTEDYYNKMFKGEGTGNPVQDVIDSLMVSLEESISDEGMKNFLIGGLSGAIMLGPGRVKQAIDKKAATGDALKSFKSYSLSSFIKDTQDSVNRGLTLEQEYLNAIDNDDMLTANEKEQDYALNYLMPRVKYGRLDLVKQDIDDMKKLAQTDAGFQQLVDEGKVRESDTKQELLKRLDDLSNTADYIAKVYQDIQLKYRGQRDADGNRVYPESLIDKMVYAASKIRSYNEQIPTLLGELSLVTEPLDAALAGDENALERAQLSVLENADLTDDQAEDLIEKLNRVAVMNQYKKKYLAEYADMKANPNKYKLKDLKIDPETGEPAVTDTTASPDTVVIKTKRYPEGKSYKIGQKYILGNVFTEDSKGNKIVRWPSLTLLGENEDGSIKIKDSEGVIRDVSKKEFEDYNLGTQEEIDKSPDARFYKTAANNIVYWNRGKKKGGEVKGRLKWDSKNDNLVFVYKEGRKIKEKVINVDAFEPSKPWFKRGAFYLGRDLNEIEKQAIADAKNSGRTAEKIKARQEARADILAELYVEVSEKYDATQKLIERKKKELETMRKSLADMKEDISKNAQQDRRYNKGVKFKKATNIAMGNILKMSRMVADLEKEIESLEDQISSTNDTLAFIEQLSESLDEMPDNTKDFMDELKFEQMLLDDMTVQTQKQIDAIRELIKHAENGIKSAVKFLSDLISQFERKYPDVPRIMGQDFVDYIKEKNYYFFFEGTGPFETRAEAIKAYEEELKLIDEQLYFVEDEQIKPNENRIKELDEHLSIMQQDMVDLEMKSRGLQTVIDKFQSIYDDHMAAKALEESMRLNGKLHEEIIGTMDKGVQSHPGNDNYEPNAKKSAAAVAGSTTVSTLFTEPHVQRANRFGFNFQKFSNKKKIKAVIVTNKTDQFLIPGLVEFIKNDAESNGRNMDANKAIFAVFVQENKDGSYELVGEDGKPLSKAQKKEATKHAIFQPFPLENLEAVYPSGRESMFREEVSANDKQVIRDKYITWRNQQLEATELSSPLTMTPSFGMPMYQQKTVVDENGKTTTEDDKKAKNNVIETNLIEEDDLELRQVLQVATTNDSVTHNGVTYKTPLGRTFLNIAEGLLPMNANTLSRKKAETVYKVIRHLSRELASQGKLTEDTKKLINWLRTVIHWGAPQEGKEAGYSNVWFDYENNTETNRREPKLYISGLGFSMPFSPTSIEENKESIINTLQDLYHNVNNRLTDTNNYTNSYTEILDITDDGKVVSKEWPNYQSYLLSPKERSNEEIPLTTPLARIVEDDDVNRNGIYFTFDEAEEMYEIPVAEEEEATTEETTETSEQEEDTPQRVTTVPVFDGQTDNIWVAPDSRAGYAVYRVNEKGDITNFQLFEADEAKANILEKHGPDGLETFMEAIKLKIKETVVTPAQEMKEAPPTDNINDNVGENEEDELSGGTANADDEEIFRLHLANDPYETTENWDEVKKWTSKVLPQVPFYRVKNIIRATKGRKALGMFHRGAIYVYEQAENGTAYHEVFEGVWKMFTDDAERKQIQDEFRRRKGSFTDRVSGKSIKYSEATSNELKEELAEEFRKYILKKQQARGNWIGKLFQQLKDYVERILSYIKNGTSVNDLFNKIDRGYYAKYTPFVDSMESRIGVPTVSEGFIEIDEMEGDFSSEFSIVPKIKLPTKQLNDVIQHMTYTTISNLFREDGSLMDNNSYSKADLYYNLKKEIQNKLSDRVATIKKALAEARNRRDMVKMEQIRIELSDTHKLWKDIKDDWDAIVDRHIENLQTYDIIFDENDFVLLNDENNSGREDYLDSRKIDPFKKSSAAVKLMLATLPKINDKTGKPERSSINGFVMLDISETFIHLMEELHDSKDMDEMMKRLNKMGTSYPSYKALYRRLTREKTTQLTDLSSDVKAPSYKNMTPNSFELLSSFWRTFKKQKPDIITVFVMDNGETIVTDTSLTSASKQAAYNIRNNIIHAIKTTKADNLFYAGKGKFTAIKREGAGFSLVVLDKNKPVTYTNFLNKLGIDFNPGKIAALTNDQRSVFFKAVEGMKNELMKINDVATINKNTLNIEGDIFRLGVIQATVENEEFQSTYFNVNGEMSQTFLGPNAISSLYHSIRGLKNITQLADTNLSYLLTDVFSKNSLLLKKLFTEKGVKKPNTDELLKPVFIDGTVDQQKNRRADSSRLKYVQRIVQEINSNLKGVYLNLVPGDASIEWAVKMHTENDPFVKEETFDSKQFLDIFKNYLIDEINLVREARPTNKSENSNKLRFFSEILPSDIQSRILGDKTTSASEIVFDKSIEGKIDKAIMDFIKEDAKDNYSLLEEYDLVFQVEDGISIPDINFSKESMTKEQINKKLQILSANYMIANIELHKLVYSDPYQYSDELKRIKSFSSPRQALLHGSNNLNTALDRMYNSTYKVGDAGWSDMRKESLRAVTLADIWSVNDYLAEHSEELSSYKDGYEETDGGGIVTIKGKRKIMIRAGMWNENLEAQYRYDIAYEDFIEGRELSDDQKKIFNTKNPDERNPGIQELYTPLKPIVSGRKGSERNYNDIVLDKFALLPISYRLMHKMGENTNMLSLYKKMQKENVDYAVFKSGRKVGSEVVFNPYDSNGKVSNVPFETNEQKSNPDLPQTVLNIPFDIISIQTEVPTKEGVGTTQGSQITKLATLDTMEAGVPIDFVVKDEDGNEIKDLSYRYGKWLQLTENVQDFEKAEDIRSNNSDLYKEIVHNRRLLEAKTNLGFRKLLASLGITEEANGNLRITKRERMAVTLRDEIFRRDVNENISDSFKGFLNGDVILEGTPLYKQIRNVLMSIARKNIIAPKISGGFKVQMFNTFFEEERIEKTKDSKGNDVYASGDLSFYVDEDGKRVCEIMVARWFNSPRSDKELLDYFNNTEEGKKVLEGIGYRIPTQKQNSIDAFRIKKFLPKEMKDTVIVPVDLVKKVGSDFDIDKLSVYLKNVVGGYNVKPIEFLTDENSTLKERYFNWVKDIAGYDSKKYFRFLAKDEIAKLRKNYKKFKSENDDLYKETTSELKDSYKNVFETLFSQKKDAQSAQDAEMKKLFIEGSRYFNNLDEDIRSYFFDLRDVMFKKDINGSVEIENYLQLTNAFLERQANLDNSDVLNLTAMKHNYEQELRVLGYHDKEISKIQEQINKTVDKKQTDRTDIIDEIIENSNKIRAEFDKAMDEINEQWAKEVAQVEGLETIEQFAKMSVYEQNASKNLDNEYISSLFNLTTHPLNFKRLLVPNSAKQAKDLAADINKLLGNPPIDYSKPGNMLKRKFMSNLRHAFVTGKYAIGISAVAQTNHSQNQRTLIYMDEAKLSNLSDYDRGYLTSTHLAFRNYNTLNGRAMLSGIKDAKGENYISDVIGQFIDGYVDISKGPWIMELGATANVAGTWLFLIKAGVPFKDVAYFMNQPIIHEYLKRLDTAGRSGLFDRNLIDEMRFKYSNNSKAQITVIPSASSLRTMIGKSDLDQEQKQQQQFMFEEFLKYAKMSEQLLTYIQGSNFDTANFNDPLLVFKKEVQLELAKKSIFSSVEENLKSSFVGNLFDKIQRTVDGFSGLLVSEQSGAGTNGKGPREVIREILRPYVSPYLNDKSFIKLGRRVVENLFDWAMQTGSGINTRIPETFMGIDEGKSVVQQIIDLKQEVLRNQNHPLHDNFVLRNLEVDATGREDQIDNLYIKAKNNKVLNQNFMINAFREIKDYLISKDNSQLYDKFIRLAILQSGLTNSPISFINMIPYEDFKNNYNNFISMLGSNPTLQDFLDLYEFQRTNPTDSDIVPMLIPKTGLSPFGKGYWNTATSFVNKNLQNAMDNIPNFPKIINRSAWQGDNELITFSWEEVPLTAEEQKKKVKPWIKKRQMIEKGDFSFRKRGLFKRVYEYNGDGERVPLTQVREAKDKSGNVRVYTNYVYKLINTRGFSYRAQEHYSKIRDKESGEVLGRKSVLDNGFENVREMSDKKIVEIFYGGAPKPGQQELEFDNSGQLKGINISSYEKGLGGKLSNFAQIPMKYKGVQYKSAEAAYQAEKKKLETLNDASVKTLMVSIIESKLRQHPYLIQQIKAQGGLEFLAASSHDLIKEGKTIKTDRWTGNNGLFMQSLRDAFAKAINTPQGKSVYNVTDKKVVKTLSNLNAKYYTKTGRLVIDGNTFEKGFIDSEGFSDKLLSLGYTEEQVGAILKLIC